MHTHVFSSQQLNSTSRVILLVCYAVSTGKPIAVPSSSQSLDRTVDCLTLQDLGTTILQKVDKYQSPRRNIPKGTSPEAARLKNISSSTKRVKSRPISLEVYETISNSNSHFVDDASPGMTPYRLVKLPAFRRSLLLPSACQFPLLP